MRNEIDLPSDINGLEVSGKKTTRDLRRVIGAVGKALGKAIPKDFKRPPNNKDDDSAPWD